MRRIILAGTFLALMSFGSLSFAACNAATVKGKFGFGMTNEDYDLSDPTFGVGRLTFDGVNKVTLSNGKISDYGVVSSVSGSGTYSLASTCNGTANINVSGGGSVRVDFVVTGRATDVSLLLLVSSAAEGYSGAGTARKISF